MAVYIGQELLLDAGTPHAQRGRLIDTFIGRKSYKLYYKIEDAIGRRFHAPAEHFMTPEQWEQEWALQTRQWTTPSEDKKGDLTWS